MKIYLGEDCMGDSGRSVAPHGMLTDRGDYYGGTKAGSGTVVVRLCETERRRQELSLPRLKTMLATLGDQPPEGPVIGGDIERLPVVELRPFTQKEWRPAKSLAASQCHGELRVPHASSGVLPPTERSITSQSAPAQPKKPISDYELWGYVDPESTMSTVSPRNMDAPCPRAFSVAGDRIHSHPRSKETGMVTTNPQALGFVPKLDRERTTVEDIRRSGTSQSLQFTRSTSTIADTDMSQVMQVLGTRLDNPPHNTAMYVRPWEYYHMRNTYPARGFKDSHHPQEVMDSLYMKLEQIHSSYLDENIYDAFDRSQTLPSIKVNKASMKKRKVGINESRQGSAKRGAKGIHRLGVTNTLDLLSHYGRPICVEQQLSYELKNTLSNIRRSKPLTISAIQGFKNNELTPTSGEQQIHSGKKANTCTPSTRTRTRSVSSRGMNGFQGQGWMSRATTYMDSESGANGSRSPIRNVTAQRSKLHAFRSPGNKDALADEKTAGSQVGEEKSQEGEITEKGQSNKEKMSIIVEKESVTEAPRPRSRNESGGKVEELPGQVENENQGRTSGAGSEEAVTIPGQGHWAKEDTGRSPMGQDAGEEATISKPESNDLDTSTTTSNSRENDTVINLEKEASSELQINSKEELSASETMKSKSEEQLRKQPDDNLTQDVQDTGDTGLPPFLDKTDVNTNDYDNHSNDTDSVGELDANLLQQSSEEMTAAADVHLHPDEEPISDSDSDCENDIPKETEQVNDNMAEQTNPAEVAF